ncbi:hypothetical protein [Streptomyces sp. CBMA123]|uniref:hypothetical protein n=1 Tax=Streptomyces sp. CBMA123 TaxID=1896313 RepID=UPI0016620CE3|nr:hypothetical protein [Streptomyces sp. CBMA123]
MSQHPTQAAQRRPGLWYVLTPILSIGLLACAPFWHATTRLSRAHSRDAAKARRLAIVFTVILAGGLIIPPAAGFTALAGMIIAPILLSPYRARIYGTQRPMPAFSPEPGGALAAVQQARTLRAEARRIVQDDPAIARELGIGRPGRGTGYDDGGLLDLNSADAQTISRVLDVSSDMAERIVTARREVGGAFRLLDEVITYASLTEGEELVIRERGVLLPC